MNTEEATKLAEAHWEFIEKWFHMIYVDAMVHGYKHGYDDGVTPFHRVGSGSILFPTMEDK